MVISWNYTSSILPPSVSLTNFRKKNKGRDMATEYKEVEVEVVNSNRRSSSSTFNFKDLVVRFLALALTLIAAILVGIDKQTTTVAVTLVPSLPPVDFPVTAKWTQMSAFVYFVIANAISCFYAAISIIIIFVTRGREHKSASLMITILDLVAVALLFSAVGAIGSIGLIAFRGNSHVKWDKVCNVLDKFCHQIAIAIYLSFAGCVSYFLLIVIGAVRLHKKF